MAKTNVLGFRVDPKLEFLIRTAATNRQESVSVYLRVRSEEIVRRDLKLNQDTPEAQR